MIDTGALTDLLLAHMRTSTGQLVGDALPPEGSGWLNGQPNSGVFVPYLTVSAQGAEPRYPSVEVFESSVMSWEVRYQVIGHGGSRSQADWVAYLARLACHSMFRQEFGDADASPAFTYRIIAAELRTVGPTVRNMSVDPPFWAVNDTHTFVCSRTRNAP